MARTRPLQPHPNRLRQACKIGALIALLVALNIGDSWLGELLEMEIYPRHDHLMTAAVIGAALLYLLLMALPFMPGIEVGLALMMLLGAQGALLVYGLTVCALTLSFSLGRLLSPHWLIRLFHWLHLNRAAALLERLAPLTGPERLELLQREVPPGLAPLLRYRYLTLALLLNLPGNALIGGGGGIALVAGMSRMIPLPGFVLLVALAVMPVPLGVYLSGA